jgi:MFS family permease
MAQDMLAVSVRRAGDFWIFRIGQIISQIGSMLTSTALPLLVFKLSGSALDLGLASAATWVPYALFGLFIGAWVDRVNRKRLMICLDISRAVILAVLPVLALLGHFSIRWIYLVTFINSTLTLGFQSATTAAIPSMVPQDDLMKANGHIQASAPFTTIIGPFLAALLLAVASLQVVLWCDVLTFVVSAISLARGQPQGWRGYARHIDTQMLREVAWPVDQRPLAYICGPTPFVETAAASLVKLGHEPARIKTERFGPTGET